MSDETIFRTIPEQVAARLRQEILSGELKAGEPIREQAVSERFGVSRGPVREVFGMLADQGLLVREPNKGVRVAQQPAENIRPLIADLRLRIEQFVLEDIFDRITKENLEVLETALAGIESACRMGDPDALREYDIRFHRSMLECHPNPEILTLWQPVVHRMMLHYTRLGDLMESYREHKEILEAIRRKDKKAAMARLAENII